MNAKRFSMNDIAQALMRHGAQNFDAGGAVSGATPQAPLTQTTTSSTAPNWGLIGGEAAAGAAAGSVVPGIGTLAGGLAGAMTGAAPALAGLLTVQNGYQAGLAPTQQSNYGGLLGQSSGNALAGYGQAQELQGQEQNLANTLQSQAAGGGPNPAQAALAQNTGNNVSQQAALMAGQRGSGANAGLIARQAAMQGVATQQNATGQAATLQAQQTLAAQQALQQQQALMGGQNIQEQGVNAGLLNTAATAQNAQNNTSVQNTMGAQGINAQIAQNNANATNATAAGLMGGGASGLMSMLAKGGEVGKDGTKVENPKLAAVPKKDRISNALYPSHLKAAADIYHGNKYADGGPVIDPATAQAFGQGTGWGQAPAPKPAPQTMASGGSISTPYAPNLSNAAFLAQSGKSGGGGASIPSFSPGALSGSQLDSLNQGLGYTPMAQTNSAIGGSAPNLGLASSPASSGGPSLGLDFGSMMASGGAVDYRSGGTVPGNPKVNRDDLKNDTVPIVASPKEIVLPLHVTQADDPAQAAYDFVAALKNKGKSGDHKKDFKDALKRAIAGRKAA